MRHAQLESHLKRAYRSAALYMPLSLRDRYEQLLTAGQYDIIADMLIEWGEENNCPQSWWQELEHVATYLTYRAHDWQSPPISLIQKVRTWMEEETYHQFSRGLFDATMKPNNGIHINETIKFEERYNIKLPSDLRYYFEAINGCQEMCPRSMIRYWSLSEFKPVHEALSDRHTDRYDYPNCFPFADVMVDCYWYVIELYPDLKRANVVRSMWENDKQIVANSFSEFVDMQLNKAFD